MNTNLVILIIFILIIISVKKYFELNNNDSNDNNRGRSSKGYIKFDTNRYELKKTLMSPPERLFFEKLKRAIGNKYDIYPQYNLDKIFTVKYQNDWRTKKVARWMIDRKSIDFLITIRETQTPFVGIELDDNSHQRQDRIERDKKVDLLFSNNGIRLIRFNVADNFLEEELARIIG
jgi:hypothetical protein